MKVGPSLPVIKKGLCVSCNQQKASHRFGFSGSVGIGNVRYCYRTSSVIRQSFFSFLNNPKILDTSYKMDLDLWDCLGRVKLVF